MKARKRVGGRGKVRKLKASAGRAKAPRRLPEDLAEFYRPIKKPVTLRLDADVVAWFQRQGRGYQTRINRALRKLMFEERKKTAK
ncbi:MAG TPA: BrnA antitoxin family protein [Terriglobales bacterium]|nr:BrnA antitoxin family protein [Terriglobales bacterium]